MEIYSTGVLQVQANHAHPEALVIINPNDGFEIGLMETEAPVAIIPLSSMQSLSLDPPPPILGKVLQQNECPFGVVKIGARLSERIGCPDTVQLKLIKAEPCPKLIILKG